MNTMKAIMHVGEKLEEAFVATDVPIPEPKEGQVQVKPIVSTLCFTDVHDYLFNFFKNSRNGLPPELSHPLGHSKDRAAQAVIWGHEAVAEVSKLGEGVSNFKVGDRVIIDIRRKDDCPLCRSGNTCAMESPAGLFAEYAVFPEYELYKVPDDISDLAAVSVEPFACGTRSVRNTGFRIGDNVLICGLEDYNMGVFLWVRNTSGKVIVVDPIKRRRELAVEFGADVVLDPTAVNVYEEVRKVMPFGADIAFVSQENYIPSSYQYFAYANFSTRPRGTIVASRVYDDEAFKGVMYALNTVSEKKLMFDGSHFTDSPTDGGKDRSDFAVTLDAMKENKPLDVAGKHITKVIDFKDINTSEDIARMIASIPEESKIAIKIWGN